MSQQINLLRPKDRSAGTAAWSLGIAGVLVLALGAYFQTVRSETNRLSDAATVKDAQLAQIKQKVQELQLQRARQSDAAALEAEIAAMRPRAEALGQLVKQVRAGNPGSLEGFARYLQALASLSSEGLWVTNLNVVRAGSVISISGRALNNDAVMRYASRLNEAFAGFGVRFNSLELTPEAVMAPGAPASSPPALTTIAFRLS